MTIYKAMALNTEYWKPRTDAVAATIEAVKNRIRDGDFVVVSEKALATAQGNIVDEKDFRPGLAAKFLARIWMPIVWGYFLGIMCHFGQRLLRRMRNYPTEMGGRHKQVAVQHGGFLQALMFGSEAGIDG